MWFVVPSAAAADLLVGPTQPYTSLDDALRDAVSGDRVLVDGGTWPVRETAIDGVLEIAASGAGAVTLQGQSGQSLFVLAAGDALTLRDVAVEGNGRRLATADGATLSLIGLTATGLDAAGFGRDGGGIDARDSTVSFDRCAVSGAVAGRAGGVLAGSATAVTVVDSTFTGNTAGVGGVFHLTAGSSLSVTGGSFEANGADDGSVVWADGATVTVSGAALLDNAAANGGTVWCRASTCTVEGSTFTANVAPTGAVVRVDQAATLALRDGLVCRHAGSRVVDVAGADATVEGMVFVGNDVGGGLVAADTATLSVSSTHLVGNTATATGAAIASSSSAVELRNVLVAYNAAAGPVVDVPVTDLTGGWSLFWGNTTADLPGALRATDVAADPLIPAPPAGSCDAALLAPPIASPAVDGGDPALLDPDGSRSDIGAFSRAGLPVEVIDADDDGWPEALDCDDTDAAIHPQAAEIPCDGIDQDCDPSTIDAVDADADGVSVCDGDCNDQSATRTEYFDVYRDRDGDGFGIGEPTRLCGFPPTGASLVDGDCDDRSADRFPGNPEVPYDGVDQDCDGLDLVDVDGDEVPWPDDCDDEAPGTYPAAKEIEGDGIDQDCSGFDATSVLVGGAGATCGCATGRPSAALPALLAIVGLRRRRLTSRSGTR